MQGAKNSSAQGLFYFGCLFVIFWVGIVIGRLTYEPPHSSNASDQNRKFLSVMRQKQQLSAQKRQPALQKGKLSQNNPIQRKSRNKNRGVSVIRRKTADKQRNGNAQKKTIPQQKPKDPTGKLRVDSSVKGKSIKHPLETLGVAPLTAQAKSTCSLVSKSSLSFVDLSGIAFERLPSWKRMRALLLLNRLKLPCSCGQTLARCFKEDLTCSRVARGAERFMQGIALDKSAKQIRKEVSEIFSPKIKHPHYNTLEIQKKVASCRTFLRKYAPTPIKHSFSLKNAPSFGSPKAKVTLVVFIDFACPHSAKLFKTLTQLRAQFGKQKLRIAFFFFPLPFHENARFLAKAALAAHTQKKFWAFSETLFEDQEARYHSGIPLMQLVRYAKQNGLEVGRFKASLKTRRFEKLIQKNILLATRLKIPGTPFAFVNGIPISSSQSVVDVVKNTLKRKHIHLKKGVNNTHLYR